MVAELQKNKNSVNPLLSLIREMKKDYLKSKNKLTEFSKGELHIMNIIEEFLVLQNFLNIS